MPFDYEFKMHIGAPRPVVFERLLRIEHLSRWFCGWCRVEPKVGGAFKFGGETCIIPPEGRAWETTIEEGDVLRRFAFVWPIRSANTRVSYALEDASEGSTALQVEHRGVPLSDSTCGTVHDAWRMCLGNLKSIAEGRTDSVRPDHAPAAPPDLRLSVLIETKPAKVFEAFADSAQVDHWSTGGVPDGIARVEPRPGGDFSFGWPGGSASVMEWKRERRIALRSVYDSRNVTLGFDFEEKASGTAIYFSMGSFAPNEEVDFVRQRGRWSDILVCLKNFVESGSSGFVNSYRDQLRTS